MKRLLSDISSLLPPLWRHTLLLEQGTSLWLYFP